MKIESIDSEEHVIDSAILEVFGTQYLQIGYSYTLLYRNRNCMFNLYTTEGRFLCEIMIVLATVHA